MKKATVILLAIAMLAIPSCKNANNKKAENEAAEAAAVSEKEQLVTEELKVNLQNLVESTKQMKSLPFIYSVNGTLKLSDKEKMVKPDYLIDPAATNDLVTLSQKYRAVAMLSIDKVIAKLYDMPTDDMEAALARISVDVNDEALKDFSEKVQANKGAGDAISEFCDKEIEAGRANFFWESTAAGLVEQVYVLTMNMDKFLPMFDDQAAADVTYNFVCVHDGIMKMIEFYPEMESLNAALLPLYVINAINVEQLKAQLIELKGEIEVVRALLLK